MPTKVITVCVKGMIGRGVVDVDIVDGELIFTLSDGTTVNLGNIMGPKGDPGENATITIGQTTTGDPGTNASVTNTGTETDAVLNFTIPKGVPAGFGTPTAKATTLDPGSDATVKVSASGTNEEKVFSFEFGIPEGLKGDTGDAAGFGTPTASVQTLTPDKQATVFVTATGEDTSKVFDFQFGIPKGDTGDAAGFDTPTATAQTLPSGSDATASVQASGSNTEKKFDFSFGIPKGDKGDTGAAAGFGTPTASASTLDSDDPATASVTSSGDDTEKVFNFTFGIPKGDTGEPAGFDTPSATASTLEAGSSATASVSSSGPDTLKKFEFSFGIPKGDKGDKGDQGEGLDILGTYDTLETLQQAVQNPVQGDIYQIGTVAPYTLYMWDETDTPGWISLGQLQGPTGADGTTFTPSVDEAGNLSWSNKDGKPNPETVNIKGPQGLQGLTGEQGTTFTPSVSAEGVLSWTNDGDAENPDPVNIRGPQGAQGAPGADGAPGQDGAPGVNGVTFTPSVSEDGTISWTNDGNLQNPDSVNIMGPQGAQGNAGPGIAAGGTAGQFLVKSGSADYQTEWKTLDDSAVGAIIENAPDKTSVSDSDSIVFVDSEGTKKVSISTLISGLDGKIAPESHASTHASDGSDPVTPASIGAASTTHAPTHATNGSDPLTPNAIGASPVIKVTSISLPTASWAGDASPYSQVITVSGITNNSKIDLQPDATIISQLITDTVAGLYIVNDDTTVTAYAVNAKPTVDLTIQATITEVQS